MTWCRVRRDVRDDRGVRGERLPLPGAVPLRGRRARGGRARAPRAHEAPRAGGRHARHLAAALLLLLRVRQDRRRPPRRHEGTNLFYREIGIQTKFYLQLVYKKHFRIKSCITQI